MSKLLVVNAGTRGEYSVSRNLAVKFALEWKAAHPDGEVVVRDLAKTELPYLHLPWLNASLTTLEAHTPEMKEVLKMSDELVDELLAADHIAISTPVHNFNVPANLKSYVDHIVRKGRTIGAAGGGCFRARRPLCSWPPVGSTPRARRSVTGTSPPSICV
ncbi:NAD(P)H-dependent oxidoreductase [Deinococcus sp.]|uniref:FMN-dependent NADH-azoreductase n=1 Tax=Deinococcus sp. TaxID=47478 RepID=UPI00344BD77F